jgi:hypothetical protein
VTAWDAYAGAVIRIEAPDGVIWQEAIFVLTPADRRIVACTDQRVTATGWTPERDQHA